MWDLAPPLQDAEGHPWHEPFLHTPPLSQSIMKKMDEHKHQHRPGVTLQWVYRATASLDALLIPKR